MATTLCFNFAENNIYVRDITQVDTLGSMVASVAELEYSITLHTKTRAYTEKFLDSEVFYARCAVVGKLAAQ